MGVDLLATFGEEIRAPITGVISYVGTVNKIPIVVLVHPEYRTLTRSTYLPATTDLGVGVVVLQGEKFARVAPIFIAPDHAFIGVNGSEVNIRIR